MSRHAFRFAAGVSVHDTQTGLRPYSADLLPWLLQVPGRRFEYESNVLLAARGSQLARRAFECTRCRSRRATSTETPARTFGPCRTRTHRRSPAPVWGCLAGVRGGRLGRAARAEHPDRQSAVGGRGREGGQRSGELPPQPGLRVRRPGRLAAAARRYAGLATAVLAANYVMLAVLVDAVGVPLVPAQLGGRPRCSSSPSPSSAAPCSDPPAPAGSCSAGRRWRRPEPSPNADRFAPLRHWPGRQWRRPRDARKGGPPNGDPPFRGSAASRGHLTSTEAPAASS